jgi:hypothetical protein
VPAETGAPGALRSPVRLTPTVLARLAETTFQIEGMEERNLERLERLRGRFSGEQCVVLCTGESVAEVDQSMLDSHPFVLGVNGAFCLRSRFHSYFACNAWFVRANAPRIASVDAGHFFLPWKTIDACAAAGLSEERMLLFRHGTRITTQISEDLSQELPTGPTVLLTIVLPAVVWCGFTEVLLLGADFPRNGYRRFHTGSTDAPLQQARTLFSYEREMEIARFRASLWRDYLVAKHPEVKVLNCSRGSELELFERADLRDVLRR